MEVMLLVSDKEVKNIVAEALYKIILEVEDFDRFIFVSNIATKLIAYAEHEKIKPEDLRDAIKLMSDIIDFTESKIAN